MKIKTSQLSGPALDWAVAKATDEHVMSDAGGVLRAGSHLTPWRPSTDWRTGGPLIDQFTVAIGYEDTTCIASLKHISEAIESVGYKGQTTLLSICRAIVASELGDEVDVPDELGGVE